MKSWMLVLLAVLVVAGVLYSYNVVKLPFGLEFFSNPGSGAGAGAGVGANFGGGSTANQITTNDTKQPLLSPADTDATTSLPNQVDSAGNLAAPSSSLLPNDANSQWSELNPTSNTDGIMLPDLMQAGSQYGVPTPPNKIPNLSIRSIPVVTKNANVSPWGVSSIEQSDQQQVAFEINQGEF